ncbi:hypothetical protein EB796_020149 [Bugula neritina]|uniref:IgGFc-binding protein N-terminal domain-containing protein n=1 Tax=Bugula neritina TaxID=10212 RepID=A0A7J7J7A7_BUGNE|nr:hypothetical protein EB796_020149 [Bugula neritina]
MPNSLQVVLKLLSSVKELQLILLVIRFWATPLNSSGFETFYQTTFPGHSVGEGTELSSECKSLTHKMKLGVIAGFIAILSILPTTECLKSQGKAFVLTFLDNVVEYWQDLPLEVWVTNEGSSDATVSISAPRDNNLLLPECTGDKTVNISAGGQHHFSVCWWAKIMKGDADVNNKVIRIDSDVDVSVIALNKEAFSADAFQVLPIDSLGSSYYSLVSGPGRDHPNTLAVIATEDDTSVTISVPETDITDGPPPAFNYRCLVHESGSTFTIRLFAHQVFYIMSFADISGTKILASNPVAVFNGNTRAAEPASESSRDHTCSQAISSGNWDKEYYYSPVYRSSTPGDMIRVQTNTPNTVITYSQANGQSGQVTLQTGEWTELALDDQAYLSSSNKFSAVACGVTQVGTPDGMIRDPSLRNLQGVTQWTSSYVFPAVTSAESTLNGGTEQPYTLSYFQVTIATADRAGLRLDGATVNPDCVAAPGPTSNPRESCVVVVSGGQSHVLNHVSGAEFGAYMFATNDKETISTTLALNAPAQCEETVMRRGDEIDNDCDGSLDEEVCDGLDNDGDGKIDEDCQRKNIC